MGSMTTSKKKEFNQQKPGWLNMTSWLQRGPGVVASKMGKVWRLCFSLFSFCSLGAGESIFQVGKWWEEIRPHARCQGAVLDVLPDRSVRLVPLQLAGAFSNGAIKCTGLTVEICTFCRSDQNRPNGLFRSNLAATFSPTWPIFAKWVQLDPWQRDLRPSWAPLGAWTQPGPILWDSCDTLKHFYRYVC